ncbi:MAG: polysaccharide biosynthesis C-terminal domain-containing protein, partial [Candidatus Bipolaricaulota bacterium]|nr:polysaccharide biosynthesis C-terminal domain-containing protein [Candidatus Bipolaricaulota bacterium]MDW8127361.1 lipid II flippase MurJ [Candidatus Bipolaricaulota bacterium]
FGLAISQAIYPALSLQAAREDRPRLMDLVSQSLEVLLLFLVPATAGLMVLSRETVAFLFERGSFTPTATRTTAEALFFYALGLVAAGLADVVAKAFYAQKDTRTPVRISVIGLLLNIVFNLVLIRPLAHKGLALATSLSSVFTCLVLTELLRRKLGGLGGKELFRNFAKIGVATGTMCVALFPLRRWAEVWWGYLGLVAVGVVIYGICVFLLRPRCIQIIWKLVWREAHLRLRMK